MHLQQVSMMLVCALGLLAPVTLAQDAAPGAGEELPGLEEELLRLPPVIVTARRWDEEAQRVPQSLTVLDRNLIEDAGLGTLFDASPLVPNLHLTGFSSRRLSFPFIRGVGSGQGAPAVNTYIDGVPQLTAGSTNLPLLDVERIEFLRGPQGTLYGRNAIGGLISIHTRRPTGTPELAARTTLGNHDLRELQLSYHGPLVGEALFLGLTGQHASRDGYTRNDLTGHRVDDRDAYHGRGQILWMPDDRSEVHVRVYGERARDGGFVLSELNGLQARPYHIQQDFEGVTERDLLSASLTWDHHGEAVDLTAIVSCNDWQILETSDFDFTPLDGIRRRATESQTYSTHELRLSSPEERPLELTGDLALRWQAGALLFAADSVRSAANEFRPGGAGLLFPPQQVGTDTSRGEFNDLGVGIFGQATLTLHEMLDLTAGLRWDLESREARLRDDFVSDGILLLETTVDLDDDDEQLVPSFSVSYHWSESLMTYGLVARGFKAGGYNLDAPAGQLAFGPETSWTWEVGFKSDWLEDRVRLNGAVFTIDWDDMQLSQFDAAAGGYVTNAGTASSHGLELELLARPLEGLELFSSLGLTDATFEEFIDPYGVDVSGNDLAFAPRTTGSIGARCTMPLGETVQLHFGGEVSSTGRFYFDPGNLESESYTLANFRVGAEGEHWRVDGWIRNAFDEHYTRIAFQPSPLDPTVFVGENGAPRTWGISATVRF